MTAPDDALGHLQAAAKEMIAAARAVLDVAEDLVEDPETVGQLAGIVTAFAKAAGGAVTGSAHPRAADRDDRGDERGADGDDRDHRGGDDGDDGGVERIVVR